jgi:ankyrin repeat protein
MQADDANDIADAQQRLTYYLIKDDIKQVILALTDGADPNELPESMGFESPLHLAIRRDNDAMIHALVMNGALVNGPSKCEYPPLHSAVFSAKIKSADTLIRYRADINFKSHDGKTPLHMAILSDEYDNMKIRLAMIETLIRRGARLEDEGLVWYAVQNNEHQLLNLLLLACSKPLDPRHVIKLLFTGDDDNSQVIHHILRHVTKHSDGMNPVNHIKTKATSKSTPLHRAAELGYAKLATTLLQNGADTSIRDHDHKTPIELARSCRNYQVIDAIEQETNARSEQKTKHLSDQIISLQDQVSGLQEQIDQQRGFYEEKLLDQVFILQQQQNQIENLQQKLEQVLKYVLLK